jgi:hypothetical protein
MVATLGLLMQIGLAFAAVTVDMTVPSVVTSGVAFTVNVTVSNDSTTDSITFNKVAAVYMLMDMKYKGPYEVFTGTRTVGPGLSTSFSFPFTISYTRGVIVPVALLLFNNTYDFNNAIGYGAVGVSVAK